jgi:hypothetical protein
MGTAPFALEFFRRVLQVERGTCMTCNREPDQVWIESSPDDGTIRICACCHHKKERVKHGSIRSGANFDFNVVDPASLVGRFGSLEGVDWRASLRFFRKNWAEYHRPTIRELLEGRKL